MPKTNDELITLCTATPIEAIEWIEKNDIEHLCSSPDEFIKLCGAVKIEQHKLLWQGMPKDRSVDYEKLRIFHNIINKIFDRLALKIIGFFCSDRAQFLRLLESNSIVACKIYEKEPEKIDVFFKTREDFISLYKNDSSIARKVFENDSIRIGALFTTRIQFLDLYKNDTSIARKVFENDPTRIGAFFTTSTEFLDLYKNDTSIARKVFENDPTRIGALFTSCSDFLVLCDKTLSIAKQVFSNEKERIASLFVTNDQLKRLKRINDSLAKQIEPMCQISSQPTVVSSNFSATKRDTDGDDDWSDEDEPLDASIKQRPSKTFKPKARAVVSQGPDHSFELKCLGILTVGGVALFLLGTLILQPDIAGLGVLLTGAGLFGMYHFFKSSAEEDRKLRAPWLSSGF